MALKTWNAGAAGNWNVSGNWSPAGVPADGDDVVFDGTSTYDCTIDVNTNNLDSFLMDTNYTGTVTGDGVTLRIEYTADGSDFTGTQGTLNAGTGLIKVSGDWDTSSVNFTFTRGTSTVDLTGTGTVNMRDYTTRAFYHLTCGANGKTTTLSSNLATYGTLTIGAGTITIGAGLFYLKNATTPLVNGGTISCAIVYAPAAANVDIVSTAYGSSLYIYLDDGFTGTLAGAITVSAVFYVYAVGAGNICTLDTANYSITIGNGFEIGGAISDAILDCGSSTIDANQDVLIVQAGSYILGDTSTWTVARHWTNASTHASFDMGTSTVTFDGGVQQDITTNGDAFHAIETSGVGTIGYQKDDLECYTLEIGTGTTWEIDAVSEGVALALKFTDSIDCGFKDATAGMLLCQGDITNGVAVTTADGSPPPTNYWMQNAASMGITADFATFSYPERFRINSSSDIDDCTIDHTQNYGIIVYAPVSITNIVVDYGGGQYAVGGFSNYTAYDNIQVTNNGATYDIRADKQIEFVNSNFDISKVVLDAGAVDGNIVSQHHVVANAYKIISSTLNKSTITKDFVATDNCELVSGTLTIDESATFNDFDIDSGADLTINAGEAVTVTAGGTVTNNGTITAVGASGSLIELLSGTPGTVWNLNNQGVFAPQYVGVRDSDASSGNEIDASDGTSFDGGNNTNWKFEYSPNISNVSVSPATPDLDDTITITCDFAVTPDYATVNIGNESAEMAISGTVGTAKMKAWEIGTVSNETVEVIAVKGAEGDADTGTTVTISDTDDRLNVIRNAIYDELVSKSAAGQWFAGFTIEKYPPKHSGFDPKTIFMDFGPAPPTEYGLGSMKIDYVRIMVNLLFEERLAKVVGGSEIKEDDLAQWFLPRVREILDETDFGPSISIDSRMVTAAIHRAPIDEASVRYIYGVSADLLLGFKGGVT